ncbi:hypothetical protein CERSUDRAFT_116486 [Gelatoporia subvermispora B]|uniref:Uncharacterized protein n=1 Tax=Ceriporiopsis subvermispora (strain B) TaxID=914234 RepID=M2QD56_CERS8|nr:hypothetical protein CERSUDRAFT_116486 [Gelatoporia subvermispora B]
MGGPYATAEPPAALWLEQSVNAAVYIGAISYGIHIVVYFMTAYHLVAHKDKKYGWLAYITTLFVLGGINICTNMNFNELTWIDDRNYPGGPLAFILNEEALPENTLGNAAGVFASALAEGFMLYRALLLWSDRIWMLILPAGAYITSIVLGILTVVAASRPTSSLWAATTEKVSLPYWALTMVLNICLTLLIVSRLLWLRRRVLALLGPSSGAVYTDLASIVVESAVPYALVSFVFVVLYGIQNTAENLFIPLLVHVECIAPELIILRGTGGKAWSREMVTRTLVPEVEDSDGESGMKSKAPSANEA